MTDSEDVTAWVYRLRRWEDHEELTHREAAHLAELLERVDDGTPVDHGRGAPPAEPTPPPKPRLPAGWGFPGQARKAHYFPEGETTSLCRSWGWFAGTREPDTVPSRDDCTRCRRLLEAQTTTEEAPCAPPAP